MMHRADAYGVSHYVLATVLVWFGCLHGLGEEKGWQLTSHKGKAGVGHRLWINRTDDHLWYDRNRWVLTSRGRESSGLVVLMNYKNVKKIPTAPEFEGQSSKAKSNAWGGTEGQRWRYIFFWKNLSWSSTFQPLSPCVQRFCHEKGKDPKQMSQKYPLPHLPLPMQDPEVVPFSIFPKQKKS